MVSPARSQLLATVATWTLVQTRGCHTPRLHRLRLTVQRDRQRPEKPTAAPHTLKGRPQGSARTRCDSQPAPDRPAPSNQIINLCHSQFSVRQEERASTHRQRARPCRSPTPPPGPTDAPSGPQHGAEPLKPQHLDQGLRRGPCRQRRPAEFACSAVLAPTSASPSPERRGFRVWM